MKVNPKAEILNPFKIFFSERGGGAASRKDNIDTRSPAIAFSLNASGERREKSGRAGGHALRSEIFALRRQDDGIQRRQGRDGTNQLSDFEDATLPLVLRLSVNI